MKLPLQSKRHVAPCAARRSTRPCRSHGAALIYALVAILIISLLILGIGRLVGAHLQYEEASETSSRLIYSAEAAANWQLNRMSRIAPNGAAPGIGQLSLSQIQASPLDYTQDSNWNNLPAGDLGGISVQDQVLVYTADAQTGGAWTPPNAFTIYAIARDPNNHQTMRAIRFSGTTTGIGDRYSIFGSNGVTFVAGQNGSGNADPTQVATMERGYLGSNGEINFINYPPVSNPNPLVNDLVFGGVLLSGGNASLNPINASSWSLNWDVVRTPDNVNFPTIATILSASYPGKSITDLNAPANNSNGRAGAIQYWDATSNGFKNFSSPITQLTNAEFSNSSYTDLKSGSVYRIIKLQTDWQNDLFGNLFVFSSIAMGPNDILILHKENPPEVSPHPVISTTCRILTTGSSPNTVTNIALFQGTSGPSVPSNSVVPYPHYYTGNDSGYIWYNDSSSGMTFSPNLNPSSVILPNTPYTDAIYALTPGIPGLAYGIRDNTSGGARITGGPGGPSMGGSITANGSTLFPVTVVAAIATQVTLNGNVLVSSLQVTTPTPGLGPYVRQSAFEASTDPFQYVLYYRVLKGYYEFDLSNPQYSPVSPSIDYGASP